MATAMATAVGVAVAALAAVAARAVATATIARVAVSRQNVRGLRGRPAGPRGAHAAQHGRRARARPRQAAAGEPRRREQCTGLPPRAALAFGCRPLAATARSQPPSHPHAARECVRAHVARLGPPSPPTWPPTWPPAHERPPALLRVQPEAGTVDAPCEFDRFFYVTPPDLVQRGLYATIVRAPPRPTPRRQPRPFCPVQHLVATPCRAVSPRAVLRMPPTLP
eukprot:189070-Prymnesium_polylepis.1